MSSNSKRNDKNKTKTRTKRVKRSRTKSKKIETKVVEGELLSSEEIDQMIADNAFVLNPLSQNGWFEKCFDFENLRMNSTRYLHEMVFNPSYLTKMDEKNVVTLYNTMLKDLQFQKMSNIKIAEMKENSRFITNITKLKAEQAKKKEIEGQDSTHIGKMIDNLLDESLRHAMADQMNVQYLGSNTYRPPENTNFEIMTIDENADD